MREIQMSWDSHTGRMRKLLGQTISWKFQLSPIFEPSSPDTRLERKLTIQSLLTELLCPLGLLDEDLGITKQRQAVPAALRLTF